MSINFSAYEIGRRALTASHIGIDVTGQNIANVNTPGYSRRGVHVVESAITDITGHTIATGVQVAGITSFRNDFIQSRIQTETGVTGRLSAERDALSAVEPILQGTENGGLQAAMNGFFGSFRDLEARPDSLPLRSVVAQRGAALASTFRSTRAGLDDIRSGLDRQMA